MKIKIEIEDDDPSKVAEAFCMTAEEFAKKYWDVKVGMSLEEMK